ncbi:MAG TPA: hypothetical protein VET89_00985 [Stellaceae bacterium]|nr:hypothetical protein [Stellaceae bacterium]
MTRRALELFGMAAFGALGAALAACAPPHKDTVMGGTADAVAIRFYGDLHETAPLARNYCAQYERVPQLRDSNDDIVNYACIRP